MKQRIVEWLATGETGASSKTMAFWLGYGIKTKGCDHPRDPSDFDRCLKLIEFVPELGLQIYKMSELSPHWSRLVTRWLEIETSHINEVGLGRTKAQSAPLTFKLMQSILYPESRK